MSSLFAASSHPRSRILPFNVVVAWDTDDNMSSRTGRKLIRGRKQPWLTSLIVLKGSQTFSPCEQRILESLYCSFIRVTILSGFPLSARECYNSIDGFKGSIKFFKYIVKCWVVFITLAGIRTILRALPNSTYWWF